VLAIVFWILPFLFFLDPQQMFERFITHVFGNADESGSIVSYIGYVIAGSMVLVLFAAPFLMTYSAIEGWKLKREQTLDSSYLG
jgi:hypothetical protein